ncbi:MAG TPA: class I SAM-dependent methyltransferase [Pyrinomonadaceae bacterium]|nr:class I SAM-dependent methyltransferase [Pyrinomonadaceae bacterium]
MSAETQPAPSYRLEDQSVLKQIKESFAPDGAAEREHNAQPESAGFGSIHYSLITNLRPEKVLAIGSRHGYVPSIIALALKANGAGTLDFVDANYGDTTHGVDVAFGGVENWSGDPAEKFARFGLRDVISFHIQLSSEFFAACESKYGYIYLDGNHSYEGSRFDFEESLKVATANALIVLHDVAVTQPGFGVKQLFTELDDSRYSKILIPAWPGLGIVQRKGETKS